MNISDDGWKKRFVFAIVAITLLLTGFYMLAGQLEKIQQLGEENLIISPDKLFEIDHVTDIHLHLSDSAWRAMQPFGGPFGIDGVGVGWQNFGQVVTPMYFKLGDKNKDGFLTKHELLSLSESWYAQWDTTGRNNLDIDMINLGYSKSTAESMSIRSSLGSGIARAMGVNTPLVTGDVEIGEVNFPSITVRYKGNGTLLDSRNSLKKSIKIDLNDGFKGRNISGLTKINLHNLASDPSYMNDAIAYQLFRDAGIPCPRTSFARVYLDVDDSMQNHYLGLYLMVENVDNNFAKSRYGTEKGALFKPTPSKLFEYLGDNWEDYVIPYEPKTPLSSREKNRMIEICKFVSLSTDEEFSNGLQKYFDVDNIARYVAMNAIIVDIDGILGFSNQNIYMYLHPQTSLLSFIPWDHDHSLGNFWQFGRNQEEIEQISIDKPWLNYKTFISRLFNDQKFKTLYLQYVKEFNETLFQPKRIIHQINELAEHLRPAIAQESEEKLKTFDFMFGWDELPKSILDSANTIRKKPLRAYVGPRHESIKKQIDGTAKGIAIYDENGFNMGGLYLMRMDADSNQLLSKQEFIGTINNWFDKWSVSDSTKISEEELLDGINADFLPFGPDPKKNVQ